MSSNSSPSPSSSSSSSSSWSSIEAGNGLSSPRRRNAHSPSLENPEISLDASLGVSLCPSSSFVSFSSSSSACSSASSPSFSSLPSSCSSVSGHLRRAAACWVYSISLLGQQPALTSDAFRTRRQQKAFYLFLRLRPLVKLALCLYLLLAFFEDSDPGNSLKRTPRTSWFAATQQSLSPSSSSSSGASSLASLHSSTFSLADNGAPFQSPVASLPQISPLPRHSCSSSSSAVSSFVPISPSFSPFSSSASSGPPSSSLSLNASVLSSSISRHLASTEESRSDVASSERGGQLAGVRGPSRQRRREGEDDRLAKRTGRTYTQRGREATAQKEPSFQNQKDPRLAFVASAFFQKQRDQRGGRSKHTPNEKQPGRSEDRGEDRDRRSFSASPESPRGGSSSRFFSRSSPYSPARRNAASALAPSARLCAGEGEETETGAAEQGRYQQGATEWEAEETEGILRDSVSTICFARSPTHPREENGVPRRPFLPAFLFSPCPSSLHSPSTSLLPELDPWWRKSVCLLLSFLCLAVLLLAAILECIYRGGKRETPRECGSGNTPDSREGENVDSVFRSGRSVKIASVCSSRNEGSGRCVVSQPCSRLLILACCVLSLLDLLGTAFVFFASDAAPGNAWWEGVSEPGLANETLAPVLSNYRPGLVARLARPLLLALFCYPVIGMLLRIVRTLPKVRTIILAALLSVLLFDWLGVILFAGTSGHDEFHSFQSGCISLLLVVTTVRLPQVLLRGYTVHEVAVLFIVVFYLLTAVLLGLFAAAFYTAYRDGDIADSRKQLALSARYLSRAFDLLLASQEERTAASVSSASSCVAVESSHSRQAAGAERAGEERGKPEASVAFEAWREFYVHYAALSGRPQCASANRGKVLDFCEGPETKQEGSRQCGGGHAPPSPLALSLSSSLVASQLLPPFLRLLSSPSSDSAIAGDVEESERETDRTKGKQHETAEETGLLDPESPAGCVGDRENPSAAPSPSSSPSRLSVSLSPCRSEPSENSRQDVASTRQTLSSVSSLLPRSSLSPSPFAASQGRLARTGTATTLQVSDESVSSREKRATSKEGEGEEEGEGDAVGLLSGRQGRGEEELDANEEHCVERVSVDAPTWRFALPFLFVKRVVGGNRAGNEFPKSGRRRHASKRPGPQTHAIADGEEDVELFFLLQRGEAQSASRHRLAKSQFVQFVSTLAAYDAVKQKEEQRLWQSDSCRFAVHRRLLNVIADVCVVASLILTYMQTRKFIRKASTLSGEEIESSPVDLAEGLPASCFGSVAGAYWIQNALSFVYLVSVVVRIRLTSSMQRYTGFSLRERFDIVVGGGVMVLELACLWAGSASAFHPLCTTETFDDLSRCLAFIRVLRGIRICFRISPLRKMIVSLVAAVSALEPVLLVLVVIFCAYGTVGMELFGGIIKCDMEHLPPKGPDMEDPTDWGVLNFNDFFASLVTLFLLTVNGWDDSLKALVKHTSVFSCGAYFVSFYILTDTIILNLLVALVLEAYDQVASSTSGSSWRPVL